MKRLVFGFEKGGKDISNPAPALAPPADKPKEPTEEEPAIQPAPAPAAPDQPPTEQPKRKIESPATESGDDSSEDTKKVFQGPKKQPPVPWRSFSSPAKLPTRPPPIKKSKPNSPPPLPLPPKLKTDVVKELPKKVPDSDSDEDDYDDDDDDDEDDVFVSLKKDKKGSTNNFQPALVAPVPEPAPVAEPDYIEAELPMFMYFIPSTAKSIADCHKFQLDVPSVTVNPDGRSLEVKLQISKQTLKTDWVKQTLRDAAKQKDYKFYDEDSDKNIRLNQTSITGMNPLITFVNEGDQKPWFDFFYELGVDGSASHLPTTSWVHFETMSIIDGRNLATIPTFRIAIFINSTDGPFKK